MALRGLFTKGEVMAEQIEMEDNLMSVKVVVKEDGEYAIRVKVDGGSINEWSLGMDETIAKGKVQTILNSYVQGLEFVQEEVRKVFAEQEDAKE